MIVFRTTLSTFSYPEPDQSSCCTSVILLEEPHLEVFFQLTVALVCDSLNKNVPQKNLYSLLPMPSSCFIYLIFLDLIELVLFGEV
jgi:hypothetical protein